MPTIRQKKAFKHVVENHGNVSRAMLEAGYDPTTAKNPKNLTDSIGWKQLMDEYMSDSELAKKHRELLDQVKYEYFVFPKSMKDEEIQEKVEAVGVELTVIETGEKGKYAFYKTIDAVARKSALDMAYKLKGSYAPDKHININTNVSIEHKQRANSALRHLRSGSDTE